MQQLEEAVEIAAGSFENQELKNQALEYCIQVKNSADGWKIAVELICSPESRSMQAVFFSHQILDARMSELTPDQLEYIKSQLLTFLQSPQHARSQTPPHMRNRMAQTLAFLFVLGYTSFWTSFFHDLEQFGASGEQETDLFLRVLRIIHEEIGDTLIIRDATMIKRNNLLKDKIRENEMTRLISLWLTILDRYSNSQQNSEIVDGVLKLVAGWVSWIDISLLMAQGALLPLIFKQFGVEELRLSACDTIGEIISKKMPPQDKMELIMMLNPSQLLNQLPASQDLEFEEHVAKLTNTICLELERIMNLGKESALKAESELLKLMGKVLEFLSNEYDDTSIQVIPCINEYLQFVRKETRKAMSSYDTSNLRQNSFGQFLDFPPDREFIPPERRELLELTLSKTIAKSTYDPDSEWQGEDDEEEAEFLDLRAKLKVLEDQIASIDNDLFIDQVASFITQRLQQPSVFWHDTELALYQLYVMGDVLKIGAVKSIRGKETRASQILYQLFTTMIESDVGNSSHPAIQLWYMELTYRHASYFSTQNIHLLQRVLDVFVSGLGVHSSNMKVRIRSWYLLYRLYKTVRGFLHDKKFAEAIFNAISPLLTITVKKPVNDSDSDSKNEFNTIFESQLYLFELCGMLFAQEQPKLTDVLLQNLFSGVNATLEKADENSELAVNHAIKALATFARGMSEAGCLNEEVANEMQRAAELVVNILQRLPLASLVREACRLAMSRLVNLLGSRILSEVSLTINCLLSQCELEELGDFLSFLGQLVHQFSDDAQVFSMFTSLCTPLFKQIFYGLGQANEAASTGSTDSQLLRKDLIKMYLQFVFNIVNNRYGAMFLVDGNTQVLENVIESLLHYASSPDSGSGNQKLAIVTFCKIVQIWGRGVVCDDQFGSGEQVTLFSTPVAFTRLTDLCFTLQTKPGVSLRDAQTRLVVMELGGLQKCMFETREDFYGEHIFKYLEQGGLPANQVQLYVQQLGGLPLKDFKRYFYEFLVQLGQ